MSLRREYDVVYGAYMQASQDFDRAVNMAQVQTERAEQLYVEREKARAWTGRMLGISIGAIIIGGLTAFLF